MVFWRTERVLAETSSLLATIPLVFLQQIFCSPQGVPMMFSTEIGASAPLPVPPTSCLS